MTFFSPTHFLKDLLYETGDFARFFLPWWRPLTGETPVQWHTLTKPKSWPASNCYLGTPCGIGEPRIDPLHIYADRKKRSQ